MTEQDNNKTNTRTEISEFITFLKDSANVFGENETFESVLSNTVKMKAYLLIYTEISLLQAKKIEALAGAASKLS